MIYTNISFSIHVLYSVFRFNDLSVKKEQSGLSLKYESTSFEEMELLNVTMFED